MAHCLLIRSSFNFIANFRQEISASCSSYIISDNSTLHAAAALLYKVFAAMCVLRECVTSRKSNSFGSKGMSHAVIAWRSISFLYILPKVKRILLVHEEGTRRLKQNKL